MRVAYIVSRFPSSSETFIARELNHVARSGRIEPSLHSLFSAKETLVHPSAEPWIASLHTPGGWRSLAAAGWWLARRPLRLLGSAGIVVRDCWREPRYMLRSLAALLPAAAIARRVAQDGSERVHVHYATYPALAGWLCFRLAGLPYSITVHAHDIFVTQAMLARKVADADFVVPISRFNAAFLAEHAAASASRMHVIHCGLELGSYEYRPRIPPRESTVKALCVASLQEHKGHDVLLQALAGAPELERVTVDLVGDGPLRSALEGRAGRLGLAQRVRFCGSRREDEVRRLLSRADVFVLPSRRAIDGQMEGLPVALMEALACGVICVAPRLSGVPELISDGVTGHLFEPGDPGSLRAALVRALAGGVDPDAGRRLVEAEFDIERSAAALCKLLEGDAEPGAQAAGGKLRSAGT